MRPTSSQTTVCAERFCSNSSSKICYESLCFDCCGRRHPFSLQLRSPAHAMSVHRHGLALQCCPHFRLLQKDRMNILLQRERSPEAMLLLCVSMRLPWRLGCVLGLQFESYTPMALAMCPEPRFFSESFFSQTSMAPIGLQGHGLSLSLHDSFKLSLLWFFTSFSLPLFIPAPKPRHSNVSSRQFVRTWFFTPDCDSGLNPPRMRPRPYPSDDSCRHVQPQVAIARRMQAANEILRL